MIQTKNRRGGDTLVPYLVSLPTETNFQAMAKVTDREKSIYRVTVLGSVVNLVLLLFKFVAGVAGHRTAVVMPCALSSAASCSMLSLLASFMG